LNFEEFIAVKGIKAHGNQFTTDKIKQVNLLESLPFEEPEEEILEEIEVIDEEVIEDKLPMDVPELVTKKPVLENLSAEEKAKIALQKSIARKKAEEKKRDDENQTKLF
jgi:topoisomerase-4 subunit A